MRTHHKRKSKIYCPFGLPTPISRTHPISPTVSATSKRIRPFTQKLAVFVCGFSLFGTNSLATPNDFTERFLQLQHTEGNLPIAANNEQAVSQALRDLSQFGLWQFGSFRDPSQVQAYSETSSPLDIRASFGDSGVVAPSIETLTQWSSHENNRLDNISILFGEQTTRIYYQVARRLALLDSDSTTTELVRLIKDNEQPWESAKVLAVLKDARAVVPLAPLLHHHAKRVRWSAAYVLAHHKDARSATPLLELLRTPLEELNNEGFSPSTQARWVKQLVMVALSQIRDPRILDTLLYLTTREGNPYTDDTVVGNTSSSNSIYGVAIDRIMAIASQAEDAETIEKIVSFHAEERSIGPRSLFDPQTPVTHFFRNPRARPHLQRLATHSDRRIRRVATESLSELDAVQERSADAAGDNPFHLLRHSALGKQVPPDRRQNLVQFSEATTVHVDSGPAIHSTNCVSDDVHLRFPEAVDYIFSDPLTRETLLEYTPSIRDAISNVMRYRNTQPGWLEDKTFGEALVSVAIAMLEQEDAAVRATAVGILGSLTQTEFDYNLQYYSHVPIIKHEDVERAQKSLESAKGDPDVQVRTAASRALEAIDNQGLVVPWSEMPEQGIYRQFPWESVYAHQLFDFLFDEIFDSTESEADVFGKDPREWPSRMADMLLDAGVHLPRSRFDVLPGEYLMPSALASDLPLEFIAGSYHTGNNTGAAIDRQIIPAYLELGDRAFEYMLGPDYIFNEDWFVRDGVDELMSMVEIWTPVRDVPRSRADLIALLSGDDVRACQHAARQLARLSDERALEPLVSMLNDNNNKVRSAAARSLARLGDRRAVSALSRVLADEDPDVRRWAAVAIGMTDGDDAAMYLVKYFLAHHDDRHVTGSNPALHGLVRRDLLGTDAVQVTLVGGIAELPGIAASLVPAVTEIERYHDGLLFSVDLIAKNSTYVDRLGMLQAIWRWRGKDKYSGIAGRVLDEVERIHGLYGGADGPGAYALLAAAILAMNDGDVVRARKWTENAVVAMPQWDVVGRSALSVVLAEALVLEGRGLEALTVVDDMILQIGPRQMPYRLRDDEDRRRLEFVPLGELFMTKAFVLSNLGWHREAIAASEEAERVLRANLLWKWIDGDQLIRHLGARIAPILESSHGVLQRTYGRFGRNYFDTQDPRGVQETYGYSLAVAEAIGDALRDKSYANYARAFEVADKEALQLFFAPDTVRFGDDARNAAFEKLVFFQEEVKKAQREINKVSGSGTALVSEERQRTLRKKAHELERFVRKLKIRHPDIAARWAKSPTDLVQIQNRLDSNTVIIQYVILNDDSYAFLIHRDDLEIVRLHGNGTDVGQRCFVKKPSGSAECLSLERAIGRFVALLGSRPGGRETELIGRELAEILIAPFSDFIGKTENVVVVPNGALHSLPWSALPWNGGFLVEEVNITVLPSSSLFRALTHDAYGSPRGLLALANPIPTEAEWGPLPGAEREVVDLAEVFPPTLKRELYFGADASREKLVDSDLEGRIVHLATHAVAGSTDETRLLLTGGSIYYDDVLGLHLKDSPLVTLSACQTGLGERLSGDQVYSLADAFLLAGARSVVYTLWLVDDDSTSALIRLFYEGYAAGLPAGVALAEAQRKMIGMGAQPFHWAGFEVSEWSGG